MNAKMGLLSLAMLFAVTNVTAISVGETCYVPMNGQALSACVPEFDLDGNLMDPCGETLGNFSVLLRRTGFGPGERRLKLDGPFRGLLNADQTFNHVLGDTEGQGLLYTFNDYLETVIPEGDCLLHVTEVLNVAFGTGDYAGAYGTLVVVGTLNQCTGVNDFNIAAKEGGLCFSAAPSTMDVE